MSALQALSIHVECSSRAQNCTFLVGNATKIFALATRILQLVASGQLTTLFHTTIITQTIALIFSQIDQNKIQSCLPIGHFLFTFPLLWKYKTNFLLLQITTRFYSYKECEASLAPCVLSPFPVIHNKMTVATKRFKALFTIPDSQLAPAKRS